MSRRAAGVAFCGIAAFLFGIRYLAAAIYAVNVTEWSDTRFSQWMGYVGPLPWYIAALSLVVGILYLLWSELERRG